ncbi:MAG TPA: hypothetical protein VE242_03275, partial [Chthoniobacterales bacterium]|nr:hypothetical protein [Chthoniobacterales bacterium]
MSASNTFEENRRAGFGCLDRLPGDGDCPPLIGVRFSHVFLLVFGAYLLSGFTLVAQTSDSVPKDEPNQSWTATSDLKSDNVNPTRVVEIHIRDANRTVDNQSVQIRGSGGHFEPYQDIETETLQLDATTVRTITRLFGRDVNGRKALVQVVEEEKHTLPEGTSNVLRIISNSDVNGKLQPVQREIVETQRISVDVEETKTTVMLPNINGGLAPVLKSDELRNRSADDTVESTKTTLLADGAGKWQLSEIRQRTTRQGNNTGSAEERVFRRDAEGNLSQVSRVVSKDAVSSSTEKRETVETYSIDVPGVPRDGKLHLVERATTAQSTSATGEQITKRQIEQPNAGNPDSGLRVFV